MFWCTKFNLTGGILHMLPSLAFFLGLKWFAMITCRKWKINSLGSSRYLAKRPEDVSESTERSPPPQQPLRDFVPSPAPLLPCRWIQHASPPGAFCSSRCTSKFPCGCFLFFSPQVKYQLHTEDFSDYVIDSYCLCLLPFICGTIPYHVHVATCLVAVLLLHRGLISFSLALSTWQIPESLRR